MSSFNGTGTFVISGVGLPFVTNTTISSSVANQLNTDLATGLSNTICRDGQSTVTANIPFGGFKATGIALATTTGDALSYGRNATVAALTCNSASSIGGFTDTQFGVTAVHDFRGISNTDYIDIVATSGGVRLAATSGSWASISDYRAKDVFGRFQASGEIIDAIPVHLAALKTNPNTVKAMFLAHEVQEHIPYAVHGEKDGKDMQRLESTDPLVPILWAEVKALRARLAAAGL